MAFDRLRRFFNNLSRHKSSENEAQISNHYLRSHQSFKLFLSAWNSFQEIMSDIRYTLCCDHPFGLHRVRALCTGISIQVFQCIRRLGELDSAQCNVLFERFNALQSIVLKEFEEPESCLLGQEVFPLGTEDLVNETNAAQNSSLIDPLTLNLEALRAKLQIPVPQGFVITAAGCQRYFHANGLQSEINRLIQVVGGLEPKYVQQLAKQLKELIQKTPLTDSLRTAVMEQVARLRQCQFDCPMQLLFLGRVWPSGVHEDCGIVVWGPPLPLDSTESQIEDAILATLAHKQGIQSLVYRRARGLTDIGTGMCLTCLAVPQNCLGGLAQSCSVLSLKSQNIHIYASTGLPQELEYSRLPVDRLSVSHAKPHKVSKRHPHLPDNPAIDDETACKVATLTYEIEAACGKPQTVTWVADANKNIYILLSRPMAAPLPNAEFSTPEEDLASKILLQGGFTVCPGRVSGAIVQAQKWEDVYDFPTGAILVLPDDAYIWGGLIDRCGGFIVEKGFQGSRLASLAREFGKPALFGLTGAMDALKTGMIVTLGADLKTVYQGRQQSILPKKLQYRDWMPGSPVFKLLEKVSAHILPLNLNVDSVDFRADNCVTYHDIVSYCHERAVNSMFNLGSNKQNASRNVKQLRDDVPKQFWVINLGDGFAHQPKEPVIDIKDITSRPMQALWEGMTSYNWEGPAVNSKGFLSVLFEATANPNLDPTAQTGHFTEKNYFLISRYYCSLHSRFGFHFVSTEAMLSDHVSRNYLTFQLRGGAADMERRIQRVHFVADILWEFGFEPHIHNDAVSANLKGLPPKEGERLLAVAGYMTIHTRQLDMIMLDSTLVAAKRKEMLARCRTLYAKN
ncbi:MAG: phosphoenolpyruvate synthase [Desulfovibrionaceae bacterium]|nr:phosphoenolpyruvate synthase [Desulfovibrionaceae bacterium]